MPTMSSAMSSVGAGSSSSAQAGGAPVPGAKTTTCTHAPVPGAKTTTCKQCFDVCNIVGSKPVGKDPLVRLEDVCVINRRNMERRVARRDDPRDQLRLFWKALLGDKQ